MFMPRTGPRPAPASVGSSFSVSGSLRRTRQGRVRPVSRLSAAIPHVAFRRTTAPCPATSSSRCDVVPGEAAEGCVKGCGWHGMQGGSGVQIPSAPPQVSGLSAVDRPRIARLGQQIGSNLFCQGRSGRAARQGAVGVVALVDPGPPGRRRVGRPLRRTGSAGLDKVDHRRAAWRFRALSGAAWPARRLPQSAAPVPGARQRLS
jgi:hypothetical protein